MPLEPLIYRSRYRKVKESYKNQKKFGESKNIRIFVVVKKTKSINRSKWNIKNKKIMDIEKIANELCVEVYATNNEGTTMIISEIIGERGVHKTYMNIHDKLMKMEKDAKWEVKLFHVRSLKSTHYNVTKKEEA